MRTSHRNGQCLSLALAALDAQLFHRALGSLLHGETKSVFQDVLPNLGDVTQPGHDQATDGVGLGRG